MYKTFTHNDLIRFLYGEMDNNEALMLKKTLRFDDDLNASYIDFKKTINSIDSLVYNTNSSELTIAKIKSFARGYSSTSSKVINTIDLILN
ncbi:MAG: hypothetical protein ISP73_00135 [Flavobacteriales bacterium]|nr:hypothetical protein [Flavobacteriales bacterium]